MTFFCCCSNAAFMPHFRLLMVIVFIIVIRLTSNHFTIFIDILLHIEPAGRQFSKPEQSDEPGFYRRANKRSNCCFHHDHTTIRRIMNRRCSYNTHCKSRLFQNGRIYSMQLFPQRNVMIKSTSWFLYSFCFCWLFNNLKTTIVIYSTLDGLQSLYFW